MGKQATDVVLPVLPKGTTGIFGIGRTNEAGMSVFSASLCHASLTGLEGALLMRTYKECIEAS